MVDLETMQGREEVPELDARVRRASAWAWLVGVALLAAVVVTAGRDFPASALASLLERVSPLWLAAAVALQAATYLAQGEVWRIVARAEGFRVSARHACLLSLAKLFFDQTLPSAGISGTVFAAKALERRGLPRPASAACVSVNLVAYYAAYALALAAAAASAAFRGRRGGHYLVAAGVFVALAALVGGAFLLFARAESQRDERGASWVRRAVSYLRQADPRLLRSPAVMSRSALMQAAIIAADTATLWALVRSLGASLSPARVFGSFMLSSVFRSVAFSPGGLGAFEASCVYTLKRAGLPLPVALSATLLFRALSFWLPMLPGLWASRWELRAAPSPAPASFDTDPPAPA